MSPKPLVSIVMPVYNAGKFLKTAVQSIFAQTFTDWELIAIDDASTDGSYEYLTNINDSRIRILRNERNMNQSFSQNRGIDIAAGKYVARMDADDISMPKRIEKQIAVLEANPEIDLLGCGSFVVDKELNLIAAGRPPVRHSAIIKLASINFPITHGAMLGKIEWWKKWRADPRIRLAQDFDILFRAHMQSVFSNVAEPLYIYRFVGHTRSFSKRTKGVYYKAKTLLLNGFKKGLVLKTLIGLVSLAPRPFLYAVKDITGSKTGLVPAKGPLYTEYDLKLLREVVAEVSLIEIPCKSK